MNRTHAAAISLFLALAIVLGAFAALRTTTLGAHTKSLSAAQVAARTKQLDRYEARLAREARRKPPALPAVSAQRSAAVPAPTVVYHRPAPVVHVVHRHGESEHESGDGGGADD